MLSLFVFHKNKTAELTRRCTARKPLWHVALPDNFRYAEYAR